MIMVPSECDSDYDVKLCTSATDLLAAYNLRIEVFHEEQKFPIEVEVDRYDPMSAHFIVTSKKHSEVVATVRLYPYSVVDSALVTVQEHENYPLGAVRSEMEIADKFITTFALSAEASDPIRVKLGRLAVKKSMRSKGIGSLIVKEAEKWLRRTLSEIEQMTMVLSSQMHAMGFYAKLGYVAEGEPYDEDGSPHILCRKEIKNDQN